MLYRKLNSNTLFKYVNKRSFSIYNTSSSYSFNNNNNNFTSKQINHNNNNNNNNNNFNSFNRYYSTNKSTTDLFAEIIGGIQKDQDEVVEAGKKGVLEKDSTDETSVVDMEKGYRNRKKQFKVRQKVKQVIPGLPQAYGSRNSIKGSIKKLMPVCALIRGLSYEQARSQLTVCPKKCARDLLACLDDAKLSAVEHKGLDASRLVVSEVRLGRSTPLKRLDIKAKGRTGFIQKKRCNVLIVLSQHSLPTENAQSLGKKWRLGRRGPSLSEDQIDLEEKVGPTRFAFIRERNYRAPVGTHGYYQAFKMDKIKPRNRNRRKY